MLMALLFFLSGMAVENSCTSAAPATITGRDVTDVRPYILGHNFAAAAVDTPAMVRPVPKQSIQKKSKQNKIQSVRQHCKMHCVRYGTISKGMSLICRPYVFNLMRCATAGHAALRTSSYLDEVGSLCGLHAPCLANELQTGSGYGPKAPLCPREVALWRRP